MSGEVGDARKRLTEGDGLREAMIAAAPSLNAELRPDGSTDALMSAYVEGWMDAIDTLTGLLAAHPVPSVPEEERCHCGRPVAYGFDGNDTHHRGMCHLCDLGRCDAYPMDCPYRHERQIAQPSVPAPAPEPGVSEAEREIIAAADAATNEKPQRCGHSSDPMCCPFENLPTIAAWFTEMERERVRNAAPPPAGDPWATPAPAPEDEQREALAGCSCGHSLRWHVEDRGCGYHGYAASRCPCLLTFDEALRDHDARVWDEGYTSGHSNAMRRMSDEPNAPTTPNPYREAGDGR